MPSKCRIYGLVTKGDDSESILTRGIYESLMENLNSECSEVLVNKREYFQGNLERDHGNTVYYCFQGALGSLSQENIIQEVESPFLKKVIISDCKEEKVLSNDKKECLVSGGSTVAFF